MRGALDIEFRLASDLCVCETLSEKGVLETVIEQYASYSVLLISDPVCSFLDKL